MGLITYQDIKKNEEIKTYLGKGNELLGVLGFTEHSYKHAAKVAKTASDILIDLGYDERKVELARIAGYMHDIGNMVNRIDHAQTGAVLAFNILTRMEMAPEEVAIIVAAIGNHDEGTGSAISTVSSALILADKTDVRRTRVRNSDFATFDIHDRVNYAVENAQIQVNEQKKSVLLDLTIDTKICSVLDYFEIFMARMLMCRRAADYLGVKFELIINSAKLL